MSTSLRIQLAEARSALRDAQDRYDLVKAQAEQRIIEDAGGSKALGSNEDERKRALLLALEADEAYTNAHSTLRYTQAMVDLLQAKLDEQIEVRRSADRASRDRLSAALESLATRQPSTLAEQALHEVQP